jgi:putative endonuclease
MESAATRRLGALGECIAARWAQRRGWQVVARRFQVGHRDLDLVIRRGSRIVFVEVKTRRSAAFGGPVGAVDARKRRHLSHAATIWIDRHGEPGFEYRFDVIGVLVGSGLIRVLHVENAFHAWTPR